MRQYLHATLEVHGIISMPVLGETGLITHMFFQILGLESKPVLMKTIGMPEDDDYEAGLYFCSVQPFSRWSGSFDDADDALPPASAECFVYQDPCLVDLLSITGAKLENRRQWLRWSSRPSDVDGCQTMFAAKPLVPGLSLSDRSVPVLSLIDALEAAGHEGVPHKVFHHLVGVKQYDSRALSSKRTYLQAVLAAAELFAAGVPGFSSGHAHAYYALLLKTKELPDPTLGALAYRRKLAELDGDALQLKLLDRPVGGDQMIAAVPKPRLGKIEPFGEVTGDPGSDDDVAVPPPAPPPASPPRDIEIGGEDDGEAVPAALPFVPEVPREICGMHVRRIKGRAGGGWTYHNRIGIKCNNPCHMDCGKTRSLAIDLDIFGPRSAEHFLACWLAKSDHAWIEGDHNKWAPSRDEVRLFIAALV